MNLRTELIKEIEAFLKKTGMTPTRFSERSTGDRTLMISLDRGRDLKLSTVEKIRAFMRNYDPAADAKKKAA